MTSESTHPEHPSEASELNAFPQFSVCFCSLRVGGRFRKPTPNRGAHQTPVETHSDGHGSVTVRAWNGLGGSGFRLRRLLWAKGFFRYISRELTEGHGSSSGFGS